MPIELPSGLTSPLVVAGVSGKRYGGCKDFEKMLKPLLLEGRTTLCTKDGVCKPEDIERYKTWASATFFIRIEAPDAVRYAKGWRAEFGPEDFVRDDHWTETALDDYDEWDAVIYNDGDPDTLLMHAHELAGKINDLASNSLARERAMKRPAAKAAAAEKKSQLLEKAAARAATAAGRWDGKSGETDVEKETLAATGKTEVAPGQLSAKCGGKAASRLDPSAARAATAASGWEDGNDGGKAGGTVSTAAIVAASEKPVSSASGAASQDSAAGTVARNASATSTATAPASGTSAAIASASATPTAVDSGEYGWGNSQWGSDGGWSRSRGWGEDEGQGRSGWGGWGQSHENSRYRSDSRGGWGGVDADASGWGAWHRGGWSQSDTKSEQSGYQTSSRGSGGHSKSSWGTWQGASGSWQGGGGNS